MNTDQANELTVALNVAYQAVQDATDNHYEVTTNHIAATGRLQRAERAAYEEELIDGKNAELRKNQLLIATKGEVAVLEQTSNELRKAKHYLEHAHHNLKHTRDNLRVFESLSRFSNS